MKIIIAGDSWGEGEWSPLPDDGYGVVHRGLEHFLAQDGHSVQNVSRGSSSIQDAYESLKSVETRDAEHVFLFVTDPHRSLIKQALLDPEHEIDKQEFWMPGYSYDDYIKRQHELLHGWIKQLADLGIGKIRLIGGLTKVNQDMVHNTDIDVAVGSFLELIYPDKNQFDISFEKYLYLLRNKQVSDMLDRETVHKVWEQQKMWEGYKGLPLMGPDGVHPSREAHQMLFQYLKTRYAL